MNRVPVAQAAKELGCDLGTIRYLMQIKELPVGAAYKRGKRWTYIIIRGQLDEYIRNGGLKQTREFQTV